MARDGRVEGQTSRDKEDGAGWFLFEEWKALRQCSYWIEPGLDSGIEANFCSPSELPGLGFLHYSVLASRNLHLPPPPHSSFTRFLARILHIAARTLPRENPLRLPERNHIPLQDSLPALHLPLSCIYCFAVEWVVQLKMPSLRW